VKRVHWLAFAVAGGAAGVAGGLFAFAKGSISPETINVSRSIDAIVMVLLGGIEWLSGPIIGAGLYTVLQDTVMRQTEYWRALLGAIILVLVLVFPGGIIGALSARLARGRKP
jgi:ABC-type branched-subunit amino acid transport system permease subunit